MRLLLPFLDNTIVCVRLLSAFSDCLGRRIIVSLARYDGRSTTDYLVYWPCWFLVARCHLFHSSPLLASSYTFNRFAAAAPENFMMIGDLHTYLPSPSYPIYPFCMACLLFFLPYELGHPISYYRNLLGTRMSLRAAPWHGQQITERERTRQTKTHSHPRMCVCLFRKEMSRNEDDECQEKGIVFCFSSWMGVFILCLFIDSWVCGDMLGFVWMTDGTMETGWKLPDE